MPLLGNKRPAEEDDNVSEAKEEGSNEAGWQRNQPFDEAAWMYKERTKALWNGYECPGWHGSEPLSFRANEPPKEAELVGTHDLIYFAAIPLPHHRKCKGTVEIKWRENTEGERVLYGQVTSDNAFDSSYHALDEFEFEVIKEKPSFTYAQGAEEPRNGCLGYKIVSKYVKDSGVGGDEVFGSLRVVAQRAPARWYGDRCNDGFLEMGDDRVEENRESIQFRTVKEAEKLLEDYKKEEMGGLLWIANHTKLDANVSSLIHRFARTKAPPVFFFEPGDLWFHTVWEDEHRDYLEAIVVARRRPQEQAKRQKK